MVVGRVTGCSYNKERAIVRQQRHTTIHNKIKPFPMTILNKSQACSSVIRDLRLFFTHKAYTIKVQLLGHCWIPYNTKEALVNIRARWIG